MADDVLAGMPFMKKNDIRPIAKTDEIMFSDGSTFCYAEEPLSNNGNVRRVHAQLVRSNNPSTTVFPGEFIELAVPEDFALEKTSLAIEPRYSHINPNWPSPSILRAVDGKIRIVNDTSEPQRVPKGHHLCQIMHTTPPRLEASITSNPKPPVNKPAHLTTLHSSTININETHLDLNMADKFRALHKKYDNVFDPYISGYNGYSGDIKGTVNIGPVLPPQRKGRVPQYSKNRMDELQSKCDELESMGVLAKPEDVGVVAEYLSPSFLVKKPSGGTRLVTAFAEVAKYSKPQPSLMPNVDNTLRQIGKWKYIISTDLQKAFYQIPLAKSSMKFCGIVTPYKGVRVYLRCAMGLPGSETALEELMSRVLGEFLQEGSAAKVANNLCVGTDILSDLFLDWERILAA